MGKTIEWNNNEKVWEENTKEKMKKKKSRNTNDWRNYKIKERWKITGEKMKNGGESRMKKK